MTAMRGALVRIRGIPAFSDVAHDLSRGIQKGRSQHLTGDHSLHTLWK
jgi:hypothetical protein